MAYLVRVTDQAEADLLEIYSCILESGDAAGADHVLKELERTCRTLSEHPGRGHVPPELERIQVVEYREISWKPYRIIYEVAGRSVNVLAVLDGRRDLQTILAQRLIR